MCHYVASVVFQNIISEISKNLRGLSHCNAIPKTHIFCIQRLFCQEPQNTSEPAQSTSAPLTGQNDPDWNLATTHQNRHSIRTKHPKNLNPALDAVHLVSNATQIGLALHIGSDPGNLIRDDPSKR